MISTELNAQIRTEYVLCANFDKSIFLHPLVDEDEDNCFDWFDANDLINPQDNHAYEVEVAPDHSTLYTVKVYSLKTGKFIYEEEFMVFVVESMELIVDRPFRVQDECFEKEEITYLLELHGERFDEAMAPFKIEFLRSSPTVGSDKPVMPMRKTAYEYEMKYFSPVFSNADHEEIMNVKARLYDFEDEICMEDDVDITVIQYYITKFDQRKDPTKKWKVVVAPSPLPNDNSIIFDDHSKIIHEVKTPHYCQDFDWLMMDHWELEGSSINQKSGNEMFISNSSMPDADSWKYFGDWFGTVGVSCYDYKSRPFFLVSSTHSISRWPFTYTMDAPKKAKVFFHKWDDNPEKKLGSDKEITSKKIQPNWFYYWSKIIPWGRIEDLNVAYAYNEGGTTCANSAAITGLDYFVPPGGEDESFTVVCAYISSEENYQGRRTSKFCDPDKVHVPPWPGLIWKDYIKDTKGTGIESFYINITHESFHYTIMDNVWGYPYNANFDISETTDGDVFRDDWEDMPKPKRNFKRNRNDSPFSYECWEEPKTRIWENETIKNVGKYNSEDWSYEKDESKSAYQGKNWNK